MKSKEQVEGMILGLNQEIRDAKEHCQNGEILEVAKNTILKHKQAQIDILEWVLAGG